MYYYQFSLLSCNIPLIKMWMHSGVKTILKKNIVIFVFCAEVFMSFSVLEFLGSQQSLHPGLIPQNNKGLILSLDCNLSPCEFFSEPAAWVVFTEYLFEFFSRNMDLTLVLPYSIFFSGTKNCVSQNLDVLMKIRMLHHKWFCLIMGHFWLCT